MATLIADKVKSIVEFLKVQVVQVIKHRIAFIEDLEENNFRPDLEDCSIPLKLVASTRQIERLNEELKRYIMFDQSLGEYTDSIEDFIGDSADRFMTWAERKTISVKDAMSVFNRSKSTIYRWIRAGKLNAKKESGRWMIAL
jgi:hypothetical protein